MLAHYRNKTFPHSLMCSKQSEAITIMRLSSNYAGFVKCWNIGHGVKFVPAQPQHVQYTYMYHQRIRTVLSPDRSYPLVTPSVLFKVFAKLKVVKQGSFAPWRGNSILIMYEMSIPPVIDLFGTNLLRTWTDYSWQIMSRHCCVTLIWWWFQKIQGYAFIIPKMPFCSVQMSIEHNSISLYSVCFSKQFTPQIL